MAKIPTPVSYPKRKVTTDMSIESHFQLLKKKYETLVKSDFISFSEVAAKKNIMGVYIIYSSEGKIIYVGSTNKFHVRFGTDLKHESTHTLIKKFLGSGLFADRYLARKHLCDECRFKIEICVTKREAEALEHFAIWVLNPEYNK